MTDKEINEIIAHHDAPRHYCCRCRGTDKDKLSKLFKYGAFFCSEECAERVSDWTLEGGQECVPHYTEDLNAVQLVVMKLQRNIRDLYNENLWEYVTTTFDYDELYNMDRAINATAEERARALAKTILGLNKLKKKKKK
jgi:hypothetical protein